MQTIKWELTPYCNLQCRHCGAKSGHKRQVLNLEENKIIANMLKEQGVKSIRFITKETCMYSEWLELFEYLSSSGIRLTLITNATLLGKQELERLYHCNMDLIAISLEGISSDTNDYVRGTGVFAKIMDILEEIKSLNKVHGYDLPVGIQLNLTNKNIYEVDEMIGFFNRIPINVLSVGTVIETGNAKYNKSICLDHETAVNAAYRLIDQYKQLDKKQYLLNFKLFSTYETVYVNLIKDVELLPTIHKCSVIDSLFEVMSDGSLCRCNLLEDEGVISDDDLNAGSIYDYQLNSFVIEDEKIEKWLDYRNDGFCLKCIYGGKCNLCLLTSQRRDELSTQKSICEKYYYKIQKIKKDFFSGKYRLSINERTIVREYNNYTKLINPFIGNVTFYGKECDVLRALIDKDIKLDYEQFETLIDKLIYGDALKIVK